MKLLWRLKDENGKNVPPLEIIEVALVHCNIFNNDNQHYSRVLYTFVPNNHSVNLAKKFIFFRAVNSEFSYIEVWIAD